MRRLWGRFAPAVLVVGVTAAMFVLVVGEHVVFGSEEGKWEFAYVRDPSALLVRVAVAAVVLAIAVDEAARRTVARWPGTTIAAVLAAGVAWQLLVHTLAPYSMSEKLASNVIDGFYGAAARTSPSALLGDFDRVSRTLPWHARVNMPGKVLLHEGLRLVTDDRQHVGIMLVVLSATAGVCLQVLATRLFGSRALGIDAMVLWMLVPAKVAFLPLLNVVSPLPALGAVAAAVSTGMGVVVAGVASGLLTFATLIFDPMALGIGGALLPAVVASAWRDRRIVGAALVALVVAGLAHEALRLGTGFSTIGRLTEMVTIAERFNATWNRPCAPWRTANLKDVALAIGPGVLAGLVIALGRAAFRPLAAGALVTVGTLAVLGALDAVCVNRGEVQRLWIFLFAPMQLAVAWAIGDREWTRRLVVGGTAAYAATTTAMVLYVAP